MRTVNFQTGDIILAEGEVGDTAYLINSGAVEVIAGSGNKARSVGTLKDGDIFGEMSLLDPGPRSATVKAVSDTECIVTTYDELISSFEAHPERALEFMKMFARRLRHMNELVQTMQPGKRRLRDIFNEWRELYEDAQTTEKKSEKIFHMV
jgi:CRP/FNR family cyclic AMP-dependent transcriptional regulator